MSQIQNQFVRHLFFWMLTLPFFIIMLAPALMQADRLGVPSTEYEMLADLGQDVNVVTTRANGVFTALFIETGIKPAADRLFRTKDGEVGGRGRTNIVKLSDKYLDGFWNLLYRAIWRIVGLWPVLSVLLLSFALPAMVDGLVVRETKLDQFKPNNPVFFWASAHSVITTAGFFALLPLIPIAIGIPALYLTVGLVSFFMWVTTSNLQTGV